MEGGVKGFRALEDDRFVSSRLWSLVYWTRACNELRSGIITKG